MKSKNLLVVLALAVLIFASCVPGASSPAQTEEVSVRLKWLHQAQFAGLYFADKEGLYAKENLKVLIEPVDFANNSVNQVLAGNNTFGVASADEVMVARSQGKPLKAVAVIFRISPLIIMSVDNIKISQPQDLIGKKLSISAGQGTWTLKAMLSRAGIDESQVSLQEATTFDTLECLQSADVCDAYYIDGLLRAEIEGRNPSVIWPGDFGVPFYADVLFTTEETIAKKPELVQRFVRASVLGWQSAIQNPEKAVEYTLAFAPDLDKAFQVRAMQSIVSLVDTGVAPIGSMDPSAWQIMYDILWEQKVITTPFDVASVYDSTFVDAIQK